MAGIVIENLKYKYPGGKRLALDNISLEIQAGEFIGIIGANGSGKSSLCQAVAGLIPGFYKGAYGGHVLVDGLDVRSISVDTLCEKVGIVFQNPFNQVTGAKLTVYEEISFGLENLGICRTEMKKRIEEAMALMGIMPYKDRYPFDLSGGQMQRMAIAGILAMQPQVMILDEPTSQLDPKGQEEVFQAVYTLSREGITVLMVEHNMEKIAAFSDRVVLMQAGKTVAFGTPEEIFSMDGLEDYGVAEPVFTKIAKGLSLKKENGLYPVTLEDVKALWQAGDET